MDKNQDSDRMERRSFLKKLMVAATAAGVVSAMASGVNAQQPPQPTAPGGHPPTPPTPTPPGGHAPPTSPTPTPPPPPGGHVPTPSAPPPPKP